jgi:hypothetical protein
MSIVRIFFDLIPFEQVRSTLWARSCSKEGEEERKGLTSFRTVDLQTCFLGFHQSLQASVRLSRRRGDEYFSFQFFPDLYSGLISTYTIWSKVSGHLLETVIRPLLWHTSQSWILIPGGPTLCLYDSSNSAGETFYRCLNVFCGMAAHSSCRAVARAISDVGRWGLEPSRRSNSSHRCYMGFRSGLWAGQSISGTLLSKNHSLTDLALWQGALSCWYNHHTELVFYHREYGMGQNGLVSFRV